MKIISMYLPQFHRTSENDEWWGIGFTDWEAVRNAEALYPNHVQPRVPLNGYYDLLDKITMLEQSKLMHEYSVYGMCFYHYYFKNGKKVLHTPAENLLLWKDIDMPFCFSWANEPWARTWSAISGANSWGDKFESEKSSKTDSGILLEQDYGGEREWEEHFHYLLPFFLDDRYIKYDGSPIFVIYRPDSIACLDKMVALWRELAQKNGFPDMYFIGANTENKRCLDAILLQEPNNTLRKNKIGLNGDIDCIWKALLTQSTIEGVKTYFCGFPGYDDTPRKGKNGISLSVLSPKEFETNMVQLLSKSTFHGNEFTFINAWNEWGEGMYLEPDELNGYGYLEAIKKALDRFELYPWDESREMNRESTRQLARYKCYWMIFDKWLSKIENGKMIDSFFEKNNINSIAIYGMGMLGKHFVNNISNREIIKYGIDKRPTQNVYGFPVLSNGDQLPSVDAIIVTPVYDFSEIYLEISSKVSCPIYSLDEVIEGC